MSKEVLRLALKALENAIDIRNGVGGTAFASDIEPPTIDLIKQALMKPDQHSDEYWHHEMNNASINGYVLGRNSYLHDQKMTKANVDAAAQLLTKNEALKLALGKMESMVKNGEWYEPEKAIEAIRSVLSLGEPEREPVAWMSWSQARGAPIDATIQESDVDDWLKDGVPVIPLFR
jgi:hypothetical protein